MKIALISDTHLAERAVEFSANLAVALAAIEAEGFDLILHLGDITADAANNPAELAEAKELLGSGGTQMLFVPGNHDIGDNPAGPGVAPSEKRLDPERIIEYREAFGADFWALDQDNWHLIGLNAQLFGTGTDEEAEQWRWLQADLASASGPIGLVLHKPLFRDGPADREVHIRYVPVAERERLLALFRASDLRFVISGHAHQHRSIIVDGVEHFWVPSVAFTIPDAMQERVGEKQVGIARLDLSNDGHRLAFVTPPGLANYNLLDHPHVYPQLLALGGRP